MPLPPWIPPSPGSLAAFGLIVVTVVAAFLWAARRAGLPTLGTTLGVAAWLALTGGLAAAGLLHPGPLPPPLFVFVATGLISAVALASSSVGRRMAESVPLWALVGVQAFRLPLELVLHRWYLEGVIPVQMTYEGLNLDIVSGVVAALAGIALWWGARGPAATVLAWGASVVGAALLAVVVGIAVTSAPGPAFLFTEGQPLQLPLHFPTVYIASVCVVGALFFHVVTFRALLAGRIPEAEPSRPGSAVHQKT